MLNAYTTQDRFSRLRTFGGRYVATQTVVFLLFCPYLSNLLAHSNRRIYMWQTGDLAVIVAAMILLTVPCLLADELVRRIGWGWLRRGFNHLFVVALGAGVLATLCAVSDRETGYRIGRFGMEMQTAWLLLIGTVAYSLASPRSKLVLRCRQSCMVISPAMLILIWHLAGLQPYPPRMDPLPPADPDSAYIRPAALDASDAPATPVYLFIFDEWSYPRTFKGDKPRVEFTHLTELCRQSVVFQDAHAPGERTDYSVPGILLQTGLPAAWEDGKLGFESHGRVVSTDEFEPIFDVAGKNHCRSILVHFGVPSAMFLNDRLDICRSYHYYPYGQTLLGRLALQVFKPMGSWTDPWTQFLLQKTLIQRSAEDKQALTFHRGIYSDTMRIIREQPIRTFAVIHYPLPHQPYILNPDGTYRGLDPAAWNKNDLTGYQRNLARLDQLVGELKTTMKQAGRFDDAMLILTSDHSWRYDPGRLTTLKDEPLTHVPLIIKFPRQKEPSLVSDRFESFRLGSLIRLALQQGSIPESIRAGEGRLTDARRD